MFGLTYYVDNVEAGGQTFNPRQTTFNVIIED